MANDKLISVQAAYAQADALFPGEPVLRLAVRAVLDRVPAARPQEPARWAPHAVAVVHGEWIHHYHDSGKPIDDKWYCSECHMCNDYKRSWYCPNCGAKMDGGADDVQD